MKTEAEKNAMRRWRLKNQDRLRTYDKDRYPNRKDCLVQTETERRKELYAEIDKRLGKICLICAREVIRIYRHEIHGQRHPQHPKYILAHIQDFIPLCSTDHQAVHRFMKHLHLTWQDIYGKKPLN